MERPFSQPIPEVLKDCELDLLHWSNLGDTISRDRVGTTVLEAKSGAALLQCPKDGCKLIVEGGTVINPSACELVKSGEKEIPVELR